jgi:hypothetical protein
LWLACGSLPASSRHQPATSVAVAAVVEVFGAAVVAVVVVLQSTVFRAAAFRRAVLVAAAVEAEAVAIALVAPLLWLGRLSTSLSPG